MGRTGAAEQERPGNGPAPLSLQAQPGQPGAVAIDPGGVGGWARGGADPPGRMATAAAILASLAGCGLLRLCYSLRDHLFLSVFARGAKNAEPLQIMARGLFSSEKGPLFVCSQMKSRLFNLLSACYALLIFEAETREALINKELQPMGGDYAPVIRLLSGFFEPLAAEVDRGGLTHPIGLKDGNRRRINSGPRIFVKYHDGGGPLNLPRLTPIDSKVKQKRSH